MTAIEELIKILFDSSRVQNNQHAAIALLMAKKEAEKLLEKEKQQIIEACAKGGYQYSDFNYEFHLQNGLDYYNSLTDKQ